MQELNNQHNKLDELVSLLDHLDDIPQEQLEERFDDADSHVVMKLHKLSKIKADRRKMSDVDVDYAWDKFRQKQQKKRNIIPMVFSAISGAAAAIVIGVVLFMIVERKADVPTVVMNYDASPQLIQMQSDNAVETIENSDSISFFVPSQKTPASLAQNISNESVSEAANEVKMRTLSTPRGIDFKVTLPDGTEVWLNAESSLQFPSTFSGSTREVILTGEAYFNVKRDESRPFFVRTDDMTVKVLGTEFDFRNYETEAPSVALVKGSVSILQDGEEMALLEPGQGAFLTADDQIKVEDVDIYARSQWVYGYFYFGNYTLLSLLTELSRWYNVGVVFNRNQAMDINLHFSTSRKASIDEVIDNLNRIGLFKLSLKDNIIYVE